MKDTTINVEEAIQEINKQNKRIEELCLEIERLNNIIKQYDKVSFIHEMELQKRVDKAIEYIEEKYEMTLKDSIEDFLDHDERIEKKRLLDILDILKGVDKE